MATYIKTLKHGEDVFAPRTVAEAVILDDGVTSVQDEIDTINTTLSSKVEQSDIDTAIAGLVDTAPSTLDTLNELAAALGDDANFATTVTEAIAGKAAIGSYLRTILSANWTGSEAPYTQAFTISGVVDTDEPFVDIILNGATYQDNLNLLYEWSKIYDIVTTTDTITFYSTTATTVDLDVTVKVIK